VLVAGEVVVRGEVDQDVGAAPFTDLTEDPLERRSSRPW